MIRLVPAVLERRWSRDKVRSVDKRTCLFKHVDLATAIENRVSQTKNQHVVL